MATLHRVTGLDFWSIYLGFTSLSTLYRSYQDGNFGGTGNQYIHLAEVLYCKLLPISKQLPTFLHKVQGSESGDKFVTSLPT